MRLFALTALAILPLAATLQDKTPAQKPVATVKEPETKVSFPVELNVVNKETTHEVMGVGVRVKTKFFMDFDVYAMGFYLDRAKALETLKESAGELTAAKLEKSKEFRAALLSDKFGKTMRLVMVRDVDADTMAEAFEDSLWPRMDKHVKNPDDRLKEEKDRALAKTSLATFRAFFKKEAEEDQVMDFTWLPGGELYAVIDGVKSPVVKNETLCWALFDVYLGADPINDDANENFHKGLWKLLHPKTK